MKEFMFIFKGPYYDHLDMSAEEAQAQMQKWLDWIGELSQQGIYVEGRPLLENGRKHVAGKEQIVTDGPFAESKETVGGYMIIKAKDMKEALKVAKGFPDYELQGKIEIAEVQEIPNM